MRLMADSCNSNNLPSGFDLYAYYVDGICAGTSRPIGHAVGISSLATDAGTVGDCEPGNPPPSVWVTWVQWRRAAGIDPTIYCADDSLSSFFAGYKYSDVKNAFITAGIPEPHYWLTMPGATSIPSQAVAVQTGFNSSQGYDVSLVADYWPGVDLVLTDADKLWLTQLLGAGVGQTSYAATIAAILSTVQQNQNILNQILTLLTKIEKGLQTV